MRSRCVDCPRLPVNDVMSVPDLTQVLGPLMATPS
jgi:hypothetical protein